MALEMPAFFLNRSIASRKEVATQTWNFFNDLMIYWLTIQLFELQNIWILNWVLIRYWYVFFFSNAVCVCMVTSERETFVH